MFLGKRLIIAIISLLQRYKEHRRWAPLLIWLNLFCSQGRGWGEYYITTECFHFFCAVNDTFNLEPNLAVGRGVCLITSFCSSAAAFGTLMHSSIKKWLLFRQKMINEWLYLGLFGNYRENRGRGKKIHRENHPPSFTVSEWELSLYHMFYREFQLTLMLFDLEVLHLIITTAEEMRWRLSENWRDWGYIQSSFHFNGNSNQSTMAPLKEP